MGHLMDTSKRIEAEEGVAAEAALVAEGAVPEAPAPKESAPFEPPLREVGVCRLPEVSEWVRYHPRGTEVRRGRKIVPALVVWRDEAARTLELCLVHEANDVRQQENVREWPGGDERGWEALEVLQSVTVNKAPAEIAEARAEIAALREIVLGEYDDPDSPILAMIDDLDKRVDAMNGPSPRNAPIAKKASANKAKRKGK